MSPRAFGCLGAVAGLSLAVVFWAVVEAVLQRLRPRLGWDVYDDAALGVLCLATLVAAPILGARWAQAGRESSAPMSVELSTPATTKTRQGEKP